MLETVELPSGVRHATTDTEATSWDAYQALSAEDGWEHHHPEGSRGWKEAEIRGHRIIVFPPQEPA